MGVHIVCMGFRVVANEAQDAWTKPSNRIDRR